MHLKLKFANPAIPDTGEKNHRKIIIRLSCLVFALSVFWSTTSATDYYVDQSHQLSSDSNPGTEDLPWETIQHAADVVEAGDNVHVKTGTYDERVTINNPGTASNKIIFAGEPRRTVIVLHGFAIYVDHIRIQGFSITHDQGGWLNGGIWLQGNNVDIVDNYIYDVPGQGVSASWVDQGPWSNIYVADNKIYACNKGITVSGYNWLVENNEIERLIYANEDADYMRFFGEDIIIRGNYMHGTIQEEIGESHTDMFQTFNVYGDTYARNIVIERNMCIGFFHQGLMASTSYSGSHKNILIRNNVFTDGTSWGICSHTMKDLHIINNTFCNIGYHGTGFRDYTTGTVKNNIYYNVNSPYWHDEQSSYENGYNLTFECGREPDPAADTDLLNVDPLFVNPIDILGPDGIPFTNDDGLQLQPGSPAIGAGENGIDIGAYGYGDNAPDGYSFFWIAPNPLHTYTDIYLTLFAHSDVTIRVYDCAGRKVRDVVDTELAQGIYSFGFDRENLSSGVYFCVLSHDDYQKSEKMVVVK
jgi:hypothetical protein